MKELERELAAFAECVRGAPLEDVVPTCAGWRLGTLVRHVGAVHRWAAEIVRTGATSRPPRDEDGIRLPAEPADWLLEGNALVLAALRAADPEAPVWVWGPDPRVRWWQRRLLHETAVHVRDAQAACGPMTAVPTGVAADGVAEFLANLPSAAAFAPDIRGLRGNGERLVLAATDTGARWTVTFVPDGFTWEEGGAPGDVTVSAPVSDLYLGLWGRVPLPAVSGATDLWERWRALSRY